MEKAELNQGKSFIKLGENLFKLRGTYNDINIGTEEIVLLSLINNLSKTKPCSASNSYMSAYLNVKVDTFRKQLKKLKDAGFIKTFESRRTGCKETTERKIYIQIDFLNKLIGLEENYQRSSMQYALVKLSQRIGIVFPKDWERIHRAQVKYSLSAGKHLPPNKIKNILKKDNYIKKKREERENPLNPEKTKEENSFLNSRAFSSPKANALKTEEVPSSLDNSVFDPVKDSNESLDAIALEYNYGNATLEESRAFSSPKANALKTEEVLSSLENSVVDLVKDSDKPLTKRQNKKISIEWIKPLWELTRDKKEINNYD